MADGAPETHYTELGGDRIAYQVFGDGPVDLLYVQPSGECIDLRWEWPSYAAFLERLASMARVITFDVRGSGASDAPTDANLPTWEWWADDALAVLDAAESEQAVVFAVVNAGPTALLFAAIHPERTRALILGNTTARFATAQDYPWGVPPELLAMTHEFVTGAWGTETLPQYGSPDAAQDPEFRRWASRSMRLTFSPRDAATFMSDAMAMDVREQLTSVRVPTLVLHREGFSGIPAAQGRYLADNIADAQFQMLPGRDGGLYVEPMEEGLSRVSEFLTDLERGGAGDRALAAVLFTDIVSSTERAAAMGDREWRSLLESHDSVASTVVNRHGGRLVKTTGDGILATFDGPGRAIRAATTLRDALHPLGIEIRAGLHTGEIEILDDDIAGIGVHIAARVLACADAGEVWVSAAVPLLVTGSDLRFEDRGERELKGVPGRWRLFALSG